MVKISYLKLIYILRENFIHDQDNTNGTGKVAQTVPEITTISKIRKGVCHYHFPIFSNRGSPLLLHNSRL